MLKNIGTTELIILAVLLLVFFGGKKIPEFIKGIADAIKEFKSGASNTNEPPTQE